VVNISPEISKLIEDTILAFSTVSVDGVPNNIAVANVKVVSENQILISDNFFNKTRTNLVTNQSVAIAVWNKENSVEGCGFQLKGVAEVLISGKYIDMVDNFEFNQGLAHKAAILVTINEIWDLGTPSLICKS